MCSGRDERPTGADLTGVLITGAGGFLGRNLAAHLFAYEKYRVYTLDRENSLEELAAFLQSVEIIFHLAGINRPEDMAEYAENVQFTETLCALLRKLDRAPRVVFASSIQAGLDNPYGSSKRKAEKILRDFGAETGANIRIYRLKNLFGKWCRPNYNSVTATFCYNIANELPISISDPAHEVDLSYIDDVVAAFLGELRGEVALHPIPSFRISLGELAGRIQVFDEMRATLNVPDLHDSFNRALYATYLSYVPAHARRYDLLKRTDSRGTLAEFSKSTHAGQIFVSRTNPGNTRGNHYHHTKAEKFLVLEGDGLIRMRPIDAAAVQDYAVKGCEYQVVDIPPGYTHSISNVGSGVMVTLFWSSEIFDPDRPDTYYLPVDVQGPTTDRAIGSDGACCTHRDETCRSH